MLCLQNLLILLSTISSFQFLSIMLQSLVVSNTASIRDWRCLSFCFCKEKIWDAVRRPRQCSNHTSNLDCNLDCNLVASARSSAYSLLILNSLKTFSHSASNFLRQLALPGMVEYTHCSWQQTRDFFCLGLWSRLKWQSERQMKDEAV